MKKEVQIVAWEGGELRSSAPRQAKREIVLALPLTRLLVRMVRVNQGDDPVEVATPVLRAASPYPDDELTVSCEIVSENEQSKVVIAAALPESAADDIADALDAEKLVVRRIDAAVLGQIRAVWSDLDVSDGKRRLIRFKSADCTTLMVLDGDQPAAIHAVTDESDMKRAETLSLLEAEDFNGPKPLAETKDVEAPPLDAVLAAVAERSEESSSLNAIPASWLEVMHETRFKAKLVNFIAVSGTIWALAMGVLFGVPVVYGFMTDHMRGLSKQHGRKYREVVAMKDRVETVRKYADHSAGALEIMKAVSDRLPEGVTLSSWSFRQGQSLNINGEAPLDGSEIDFKEEMESLCYGEEGEEGERVRVFPAVHMGGTRESRGMRHFSMELMLKADEGEAANGP